MSFALDFLHLHHLSTLPSPLPQLTLYTLPIPNQSKIKETKRKSIEQAITRRNPNSDPILPHLVQSESSRATRVFIGLSFKPMLSGERSSGEMQDGLRGLLGLSLNWHGLYNPYPMRKNSMGISIACGCSSVTIDPQAWTCTPV